MNKVLDILLKIKAIVIKPEKVFTWASGIKSPIYIDNRLINSFVKERKIVERSLADLVTKHFPEVNYLVGTATGAISHASYVSDLLSLPMAYVRSSQKNHGKQKIIEGTIFGKAKVVVIEDLISTGTSVLKVIDILKNNKVNVLGVVSIFSYNLPQAKEKLKNIKVKSLCTFEEVIEDLKQKKKLGLKQEKMLKNFRKEIN